MRTLLIILGSLLGASIIIYVIYTLKTTAKATAKIPTQPTVNGGLVVTNTTVGTGLGSGNTART